MKFFLRLLQGALWIAAIGLVFYLRSSPSELTAYIAPIILIAVSILIEFALWISFFGDKNGTRPSTKEQRPPWAS